MSESIEEADSARAGVIGPGPKDVRLIAFGITFPVLPEALAGILREAWNPRIFRMPFEEQLKEWQPQLERLAALASRGCGLVHRITYDVGIDDRPALIHGRMCSYTYGPGGPKEGWMDDRKPRVEQPTANQESTYDID